jgi:hypothetical protein
VIPSDRRMLCIAVVFVGTVVTVRTGCPGVQGSIAR